ncbi:MAG: YdcF family protein [Aphanothece sp. CMT-3BRIN-NPC111]|jgi:uncharacterized SAM-binding protein YcdF (DUF218 family)|nr:YdcF family protein [Aphanothece sp. CMT-3BRIN-NPC111]
MFLLLTRVLLWLLISLIVYYVLLQLIPKQYLAWFGALVLFVLVVLAFLNPNDRLVSSAGSLLSFPLKPLGLSILLLMIALREGLKKTSGRLVVASLLILWLSSTPNVAYQLVSQAEGDFIQAEQLRQDCDRNQCPPQLTPPAVEDAGSIVVLGQGAPEGNLTFQTQILPGDIGSRLLYAAQIYQEQLVLGNRPLVIVSADPRSQLKGDKNAQANNIPTLLRKMGVPQDKIVVEARGADLRSSAVEVEKILKQRGLANQPIILISSALTSQRARLTFAQMRLKPISRATDFYTFQPGGKAQTSLQAQDFIPTVAGLAITTRVIEEYLASIYYFLRGWLSPVIF